MKNLEYLIEPIKIGNNVWIDANTITLRGTTIGDNAVIAVESVVKGIIPLDTTLIQKRLNTFIESEVVVIMIRVLHVIGSLNHGGSQAMVMNVYRNIDRTKIQFDFVIDRKDQLFFEEEIKKLGGRVFIAPIFNFKNLFVFIKFWCDFFKNNPEYTIIHGHVRSTAAIYLFIAKKAGLYTISHSHNNSSGKGINAYIKDCLQFPIRYIADYFFACSSSAGKWLFGKRICESNKFEVLKNAIDSELFVYKENVREEMRREMGLEGNFVLGNIGRFHYQKNHTFILDVFSEVLKIDRDAKLLLVGDGELTPNIKKKAQQLNLMDSIIFTGAREDTYNLLHVMDLFIFPSIYEGFGIVAIEAQANGLQCIVADTIQKETFITDLIEVVSLEKSCEEWAEVILKYKNKVQHRYTADKIISSGFDIKNMANELEQFYLQKSIDKEGK